MFPNGFADVAVMACASFVEGQVSWRESSVKDGKSDASV